MKRIRCSRCDHPIEYCECLTTPPRPLLGPNDVLIDGGLGKPVVIRPGSRLLSVGVTVAFLLLPVAVALIPFLGALAFSGMSGGVVCWHQVAGFLTGILLALGLTLSTPYILLRLAYPRRRRELWDPYTESLESGPWNKAK